MRKNKGPTPASTGTGPESKTTTSSIAAQSQVSSHQSSNYLVQRVAKALADFLTNNTASAKRRARKK